MARSHRTLRRTLVIAAAATGVVGIASLAYFGVPAYRERSRQEQVAEAFRNLFDIHLWMSGYYEHYRTYAKGDVCGASVVPPEKARYFNYACAVDTTNGPAPGQSYIAIATGTSPSTTGFKFTIDQNKNRATLSIPPDWGPLPANARSVWIERKP